jgi:tetratricopeptide (TPR) repeat protein/TolB-like protein
MSSIIEGYSYDIFISYRQKDNKYDGWVTEFVDNLKKELEATFKEEISVYFDINPHDGLLETHDVDASLKDKLKCLVFIPIISRTYCDPKSFAWEHEFKAFIAQASKDQFGLKVKLPNGNVANRVLPIQIHELNSEDKVLIEKEVGGYLRAVEFIYKEQGVNRPLTPYDDEKININKTRYRNQINKVANAIEEIINSLKSIPSSSLKEKLQPDEPLEEVKKEERIEVEEKPAKLSKRKLLTGGILLAVLFIIAAIFAYPKIFKRDTLEKLRSSGDRISVAVMPFQNMTNDTLWNVWQDGIQNELINKLTNSEELRVRQSESISELLHSKGITSYASITPSVASIISKKLDANIFIYGSIKQAGATIRINTQLINSKTKEAFKSFQIDGTAENILQVVDSVSDMVKNSLIISRLEKEVSPDILDLASTDSPEAYKYFIYGQKAYNELYYTNAIKLYLQALAIDSNLTYATIRISTAYGNIEQYDQAKKWCLRAYNKRDQMPMQLKILTNWVYATFFETPNEEIRYLKQLLEFDDQFPVFHYSLGNSYYALYQYDKAILAYEKALEIYDKWDSKPNWAYNYTNLGFAYYNTGQYKKLKILFKKAEKDFPDDFALIYLKAILSLKEGDTIASNQYIEKLVSILTDDLPEAAIPIMLADIYSQAGILDKSEEYYRQALSMEPKNPKNLYYFAYFLIDKDRNINEGLELVNKALELQPDNYSYIGCKGWGLYKQGKYKESLEFLEKSWELKPIYDHDVYLHLVAAKKAVANQKNN